MPRGAEEANSRGSSTLQVGRFGKVETNNEQPISYFRQITDACCCCYCCRQLEPKSGAKLPGGASGPNWKGGQPSRISRHSAASMLQLAKAQTKQRDTADPRGWLQTEPRAANSSLHLSSSPTTRSCAFTRSHSRASSLTLLPAWVASWLDKAGDKNTNEQDAIIPSPFGRVSHLARLCRIN